MIPPFVSCIMPTANRQKYVPLAIQYFLAQDYPNAELVIIDDGIHSTANLVPEHPLISYYYTENLGSIGLKRNYACKKSIGQIIIHWDDDDWHAPNWVSSQVYHLLQSGADICGIKDVNYYDAIHDKFYTVIRQYNNEISPSDWVHGATIGYWKSFWQAHPFGDYSTGEDDDFIINSRAKLCISQYTNGFVALLHPHNTIIREFENPKYKKKR